MTSHQLTLQPHQQRAIDEKEALDKKITALGNFIGESPFFKRVDPAEQGLMMEQLRAMRVYSEILGERIAAFLKV